MNAKQAKLLRYFEKASGDTVLANKLRLGWPTLTNKRKGQLTTWLKKVVVTMMKIKELRAKQTFDRNAEVLKGFV